MKLSKSLLFIVLCGISGAAQAADAGELAAQAADAAAARAAQVQAAQAAADAAARSAQAGDTVAARERTEEQEVALRKAQVKPTSGNSMLPGFERSLGLQNDTNTSGGTGRITTSPITTEPVTDGPIDRTAVQTADLEAVLDGGAVTHEQPAQSKELQVIQKRINFLTILSKDTGLTSMDILLDVTDQIYEMGKLYENMSFDLSERSKVLTEYANAIHRLYVRFDFTSLTESDLYEAEGRLNDLLSDIPLKEISRELFYSLDFDFKEIRKNLILNECQRIVTIVNAHSSITTPKIGLDLKNFITADQVGGLFEKILNSLDLNTLETMSESDIKTIQNIVKNRLVKKNIPQSLKDSLASASQRIAESAKNFEIQKSYLVDLQERIELLDNFDNGVLSQVYELDPSVMSLAQLTERTTILGEIAHSCLAVDSIQMNIKAKGLRFFDQSDEKQLVGEVDDFKSTLSAVIKGGLRQDQVTVLVSKAKSLQSLFNALEKVSTLDDQVKLYFTDAQKDFYVSLKSEIIPRLGQVDNTKVLFDFANAVKIQNQVTRLQRVLDKPVTSSLIDSLITQKGLFFIGVFKKQLAKQLVTLKSEYDQLVLEEKKSLIRLSSPVTALVQRGNNISQEASTRANKALTGLAKLCRVFSKRLADWVQAKKEYTSRSGSITNITGNDLVIFKKQLGTEAQKVELLSKTLDLEKISTLKTNIQNKTITFTDLKKAQTQLQKFLADLKEAQQLLKTKQIISFRNDNDEYTVDQLIQQVEIVLSVVDSAITILDGQLKE